MKYTKVNGGKGEKRDFDTMNKTVDVNTHKISGGKNGVNFLEISSKKPTHGGRSKKRDFDTMNKTTDANAHKILGSKDSASFLEVSLKNPSPEIKMRTTYLDQSVMRNP